VIRALVDRIFPAGRRYLGNSHYGSDWNSKWLRERRVAHKDIFRFYLERVFGEGLQTFADAEQAWLRITDADAFSAYLSSVDPQRLQAVIAGLEAYEEHFGVEQAVPGAIVLLNLLPKLPDYSRGMFDLSGSPFAPGLIVVCFGRFWVRGLPFPNARRLGHSFQWKNTLPWHLGPAAKIRILRFKNLPPFRHYRGLQNHVCGIHQGWPRQLA